MNEQTLVIGNTYFSLMYADRHLLIPEIQTLVYLGRSQTDACIPIHLFQHAWSYHNDGNWKKMSPERKQQFDEVPLLFFEVGNLEPICDGEGLLKQLNEWHIRTSSNEIF